MSAAIPDDEQPEEQPGGAQPLRRDGGRLRAVLGAGPPRRRRARPRPPGAAPRWPSRRGAARRRDGDGHARDRGAGALAGHPRDGHRSLRRHARGGGRDGGRAPAGRGAASVPAPRGAGGSDAVRGWRVRRGDVVVRAPARPEPRGGTARDSPRPAAGWRRRLGFLAANESRLRAGPPRERGARRLRLRPAGARFAPRRHRVAELGCRLDAARGLPRGPGVVGRMHLRVGREGLPRLPHGVRRGNPCSTSSSATSAQRSRARSSSASRVLRRTS